LSLSLRYQF